VTRATSKLTYSARRVNVPSKTTAFPVALNDAGQAIMGAQTCPDCAPTYYFWSAGAAIKIGQPAGVIAFQPYALGGSGVFAGYGQESGNPSTVESFIGRVANQSVQFDRLLDPSGNPTGVIAFAMDAAGDILGQNADDPSIYYLWPAGAPRAQTLQLPLAADGPATITNLDSAGDFAGVVQQPQGHEIAVWPGGQAPLILPGSLVSEDNASGPVSISMAVSGDGSKVFVTASQPLVDAHGHPKAEYWIVLRKTGQAQATASQPFPIGTLSSSDGSSAASAISPSGWVIGASVGQSSRAFLYRPGKMTPIRKLITSGGKPNSSLFSQVPLAVNAKNQIVLGDWLLTPRG
jgi:hypothetical protein